MYSIARLHSDYADLVALIERAVAGRDITEPGAEADNETA